MSAEDVFAIISYLSVPDRTIMYYYPDFMRILFRGFVLIFSAFAWTSGAQPILDGDITVSVSTLAVLPDTRDTVLLPERKGSDIARVNFVRSTSDGRMFANDQRGQLYEFDGSRAVTQVFDLRDAAPDLFDNIRFNSGNAEGFISFEFHPEFNSVGSEGYGKFYTIHSERTSAFTTQEAVDLKPDFVPPDFTADEMRHHTVISEWAVSAPGSTDFSGSRRELLRVGTRPTSYFHPFGDLRFNPYSLPGDDDYGLLYISGGDHGFINGRGAGGADGSSDSPRPEALQRTDSLAGTVIRIDPRDSATTGGTQGLGDYTVPDINPFATDGDADSLGEILAYGFRNGHRMSFDESGNIFVSSIGQAEVETVYLLQEGKNHGWSDREGRSINGLDTDDGGNGNADTAFVPDPIRDAAVDDNDDFVYPVLEYYHEEGRAAIAGGVVYRGDDIPELIGKFVFGDLLTGDLFYADLEDLLAVDLEDIFALSAEFYRLNLVNENGDPLDAISDLTGGRVDMRLHLNADGEILFSSKTGGFIGSLTAIPEPATAVLLALPALLFGRSRRLR
ncbi:MAG: PQQ-dependent sugar dehydrogenase [Planctomycetota bacterium]